MYIYCLGARGQINQVSRIEQGMVELGAYSNGPDMADAIYCNDPGYYDAALGFKNKKKIFNVLDIPPHLLDDKKYDISRYSYIHHGLPRSFNPEELREKLLQADVVTCICDEVKWQLKKWCEIDAITIYNPVQDVREADKFETINGNKYKYLYVGRANDPNKRFEWVKDFILCMGDRPEDLCSVGPENPHYGHHYGFVDEGVLAVLYHHVNYLLFPSAFKSIGLPALEAVIAGTIPIVTNDDPCSDEFFKNIAVSVEVSTAADMVKNPLWDSLASSWVKKNGPIFAEKFSGKQIAQNILEIVK